jgi:hypothetical protein
MKTCKELYAVFPYETAEPQILAGCYYNHIKEARLDYGMSYAINYEKIQIRIIKEFDFDGRRFWRLATVWFDSAPVMVIQNAGREGDDHYKHFITNKPQFDAMCRYVETLTRSIDEEGQEMEDVYSEDTEIGEPLISFYGNSLYGHFERYTY